MITTHEFDVEGQHLVALCLNPEAVGEPIVLLPGFTTSVRMWLWPEVAFLQEHGPCYSLSLPGHYPARFPPGFDWRLLTPEMVARVLTTAIHELLGDQQRFTLVGLSLGGTFALTVAGDCPEMVSRLVCVSGGVEGKKARGAVGLGMWLARHGFLGRAIDKSILKTLGDPKGYPNAWRRLWGDPAAFDAWPGREAFLESSLADTVHLDFDSLVLWHRSMNHGDIRNYLPRITAPTLVLAGQRDPLVPLDQALLIAESVPKAELVTFQDAGHIIPQECPEEFRGVVEGWLRKTG